jgi:hypothetical protein
MDERAILFNDSVNQRVATRANRDNKIIGDALETMGITTAKRPLPEAPPDPGVRQTGVVDDLHEQFRDAQRKRREGVPEARDRVSVEQ